MKEDQKQIKLNERLEIVKQLGHISSNRNRKRAVEYYLDSKREYESI